ncbi:sugar ABC transporter substrate-binding protein [Streptomyces sp. NPDC007264]|uniref:sugar ABC transporter substrate-binding protein n=1 Tax=Streptomyces sp. NPDC007264 TaxID=3364777 RepID=UPI0036D91897
MMSISSDARTSRAARALPRPWGIRALAALASAACLTVTGCTATDGDGGSHASKGKANMAAAKQVVETYSEPTPFPVDQPLARGLASGRRISFMQCASPFCALLAQLYGMGTKTMGTAPVDTVKSGASADGVQTALSSITADDPAALLLPAVNLGSVGASIKKAHQAGIPIVGAGVMGGPEQGIDAPVNGPLSYERQGRILADWAVVTAGGDANIAWYRNPELDFTKVETDAFTAELKTNCPGCTVRYVDIPLSDIGTRAPSRVVSDLQAHPDTDVALFSSLETATGLPPALRSAGITKVKIAGSAPVPSNLQDMKNGGIDAAVGLDAGVLAFTQLDAAVRLATGQPLTAAEKTGEIPLQLITKDDLPADVSKGFSAYPDFVQRFSKLWAKARKAG